MPKVSVIIPVYGVEKYIEHCARSLFEQTLDDIEYLFIDDCTPDRSIDILKQVLEEYPNRKPQVTIHRMEKNSGQAKVREWGMCNATGEYVIHCDSDDWVEKDGYKSMYEAAKNYKADVVVCGYNWVTGDGFRSPHFIDGVITKDELAFKYVSLCCKLVKRTVFTQNSFIYPQSSMCEDRVYSIQIALYSNGNVVLNKPYYNYVCNEGSICQRNDEGTFIKRWNEVTDNVKLVELILNNSNLIDRFKDELTSLKLTAKQQIAPMVLNPKYYYLWLKTFSEINFNVLYCKKISKSARLRYILTAMGLFPVIRRIRHQY